MFPQSIVHRAVIHYLHFTRSLRKVSAIYGTSPASLSRWVRKSAAPVTTRKTRGPATLQAAVRDVVAGDAFQTLDDIVAALKKRGIAASTSTVHRHLKLAGYSRKRAVHRFSKKERRTRRP